MAHLAPTLIAGAVSALLYFLVFLLGMGSVFLFLPTLPLLWLSFSNRFDASLHAGLLATLLIAVLLSPMGAGIIYFPFLALPSWYLGYGALKCARRGNQSFWFPITAIFARMMTLASFALLAVTLYYQGQAQSLPALVEQKFSLAVAALSADFDEAARAELESAIPLYVNFVLPAAGWMWALTLFLHAWVVNRELIRQERAVRPDLVVHAFPPPNWIITLLALCALAAAVGSESLAFWGRSSLVLLLFPYFLLGLSLLHRYTKGMHYRGFILFTAYFLMLPQPWLMLLTACAGLVYHLRLLNKYLSAGGTSSKS